MGAKLDWPLMRDNITREDREAVISHLQQENPRLTHGEHVAAFEAEWSTWLGVKYSVMVNSGSSANLLTLSALRELSGTGEVIVPPLTWVSDIASVLQCGMTPIFADIAIPTLGMDTEEVLRKLSDETKAVFLSHVMGYNALTRRLLDELAARHIPLIEDACESYGALFEGRKVGSFGWVSNFSFYYAHHLTTIEGGMISTSDADLYQMLRMMRSHGMVREATSKELRRSYCQQYADLKPDFIFAFPAYNMRPTEISAIIGRSQLKRLDADNRFRARNLDLFLSNIDPEKFQTDFAVRGSCNYALTVVLRKPDVKLWKRVEDALREYGVEFRRGLSGGGNQLRQPYLRRILNNEYANYPNVDHVHFHGCYIGNYPALDPNKIYELCKILNGL